MGQVLVGDGPIWQGLGIGAGVDTGVGVFVGIAGSKGDGIFPITGNTSICVAAVLMSRSAARWAPDCLVSVPSRGCSGVGRPIGWIVGLLLFVVIPSLPSVFIGRSSLDPMSKWTGDKSSAWPGGC